MTENKCWQEKWHLVFLSQLSIMRQNDEKTRKGKTGGICFCVTGFPRWPCGGSCVIRDLINRWICCIAFPGRGAVAMATTPQALQVNGGKLWFCQMQLRNRVTAESTFGSLWWQDDTSGSHTAVFTPHRPLNTFQLALSKKRSISLINMYLERFYSIFPTCTHSALNPKSKSSQIFKYTFHNIVKQPKLSQLLIRCI